VRGLRHVTREGEAPAEPHHGLCVGPAAWLGPDYDGLLQSDGYAVYNQFTNATHAVCWAHARRYFHDAQDSTAERAGYVLAEIQKLYAIERTLRERAAAPAERARVRGEKAAAILEGLKTYIKNVSIR